MKNEINIQKAGKSDLSVIKDLLNSHHLPTGDIGTSNIHFYTIKNGEKLIACAGIELFETTGLLRSVAVYQGSRGRGIGSKLVRHVLDESRNLEITSLYLLTETAESFFLEHGFIKEDRSQAPAQITGSTEFSELCPSTAVLMKKNLG